VKVAAFATGFAVADFLGTARDATAALL